MPDLFHRHRDLVAATSLVRVSGRVTEVIGLTIVAEGVALPVGSMCAVARRGGDSILAEVVGLRGDRAILMPLREPDGVAAGDRVSSRAGLGHVAVGRGMLGAVLDGIGRPIGGKTDYGVEDQYPCQSMAPAALTRPAIDRPLPTGIRSIDAMHTLGGGQRLGVFAGTGVGKSVLMGMLARNSRADVIVTALVGERGREVGDFLRKDLGDEGLSRSVLVMSTSDESPVLRVRAALVATAVAEYFRDQGADVLLLMDSTTRIAMAQRQIGLAAGEPPTTKGYPPSVFSLLPRLMERSGRTATGSITGLYTVLVEGDDLTDPIADAIRGILDGHVWLSRDLSNRGHYPAVSVLDSVSRLMPDVTDEGHRAAAARVRRALAVWRDIEDLVNIGAYAAGANVEFDTAVRMKPAIDEFLQQSMTDRADFEDTRRRLVELADKIEATRKQLAGAKTQPVGAGNGPNRTGRARGEGREAVRATSAAVG